MPQLVALVWGWPPTDQELTELQRRLATAAQAILGADPWSPPAERVPVLGGCFVAFARGDAGPGRPGDRAWAAAVTWALPRTGTPLRKVDQHLRGRAALSRPRQADDVLSQAVVADRAPAAYSRGLLARREGPILGAAVAALPEPPDVLLVDATGIDHPRGAGLALHLGAVAGVPTVGATRRPLLAEGRNPELRRGALAPLHLEDRLVGYWVCTRTGARAIAVHAGWRTTPETAAQVVLSATTEAARTPVPMQEARRVAREGRALARPVPWGGSDGLTRRKT